MTSVQFQDGTRSVGDEPRSDDRRSPAIRQEKEFLDHVLRVEDRPEGYVAALVHLSRLTPGRFGPEEARRAIGAFEEFVVANDARLFHLGNDDIVVIARGAPEDALERVVTRLRYMFRDDPLSRTGEEADRRFCSWFDIGKDHADLLAYARDCNSESDVRKREAAHRVRLAAPEAVRARPLTPGRLEALEQAIAASDITGAFRSQAVCGLRKNQPPQPVFDERYVSIAALEEALSPDVRLEDDPWLFRRLTASLDEHMLGYLGSAAVPERAISLNIAARTVLSPSFDRMEQVLRRRLAGKLVVELQAADFFLDPMAFAGARDLLRDRGHTLCLDGATYRTLPYLDRTTVGVDLFKLHWSEDMPRLTGAVDRDAGGAAAQLMDAVDRIGAARLILCRCDGPVAIEVGQALGIALFQGRHVDYLLAMQRTVSQRANRLRHALVRRETVTADRASLTAPMTTAREGRSGSLRLSGYDRASA